MWLRIVAFLFAVQFGNVALAQPQLVKTYKTKDFPRRVVFSSKHLAVFEGEDQLKIWASGEEEPREFKVKPMNVVAFFPGQDRFLACFFLHISIQSATDGKVIKEFEPVPDPRPGRAYAHVSGIPIDGFKSVIAAAHDNKVRLWDMETGKAKVLWESKTEFYALQFSPDGKLMVILESHKKVTLNDARTGKLIREYPIERNSNYPIMLFGSNNVLFLESKPGVMTAFDVTDDKSLWSQKMGTDENRRFSASPDDKLAAFSSDTKTVHILDAKTGKERWRLPAYQERVIGLAFNPDSSQIAVAGMNREVQIWSIPKE